VLSQRNTPIRIPSERKVRALLKVKDSDGNPLDLRGLKGLAIIGQGNDKREDYQELELKIKKGELECYFPPLSPGTYRIKLKLEKKKKLVYLEEFKVIVLGAKVSNPSSRMYGGPK